MSQEKGCNKDAPNPLVEFQVVVLAGGSGSRLSNVLDQASDSKPLTKAMLPVANRPMIWYCLKNLHECTFGDIIVVTQEYQQEELSAYLQQEFKSAFRRLEVIGLSSSTLQENEEEFDKKYSDSENEFEERESRICGTAEALYQIRDLLTGDIVVISCDIIGNIDFFALANRHRSENAACTIYLVENDMMQIANDSNSGKSQQKKKASKADSHVDNSARGNPVCIATDEDQNYVLAIQDKFSIEHGSSLKIPKLHLYHHPKMDIKYDYYDPHIYILKSAALKVFNDMHIRNMLYSIRFDLVPYLTTMQMTSTASIWSESRLDCDVFDDLLDSLKNGEDLVVNENGDIHRSSGSIFTLANPPPKPKRGNRVVCCLHPEGAGLLCRVNNALDYHELNLQFCAKPEELRSKMPEWMLPPPNTKKQLAGKGGLIEEGTSIGQSTFVTKSVVGADCSIGDNCKLNRTVVMNNTKIDNTVALNNCIIGRNVAIGKNSKLTNCTVRSGYTVPDGTIAEDEILPSFTDA